nr:LPS assembly lipoprotein LptE [Kiloniella laminariae]
MLWLSACGFQPVYRKDTTTGESAYQQLHAVRIDPLPDRPGQILHNLLRDRINPLGQPREPLYSLKATITETEKNLAVRLDNTASRTNLGIEVQYYLVEITSGKTVLSAKARSTGSYDKLNDPYATLVAEETTRKRVLRQISNDMALQVGAYLNRAQ